MKNFVAEFKNFIMRGNVVELAVAVVIGSAFGAIVTSLVNDIITPLISYLLGSSSFEGLFIQLNAETTLNYGLFLQAIIKFLVIAFAIFMIIRLLNRLKKPKEEEPEKELEPSETELLQEILIELRRNKRK